jgi:hypothetical protein
MPKAEGEKADNADHPAPTRPPALHVHDDSGRPHYPASVIDSLGREDESIC